MNKVSLIVKKTCRILLTSILSFLMVVGLFPTTLYAENEEGKPLINNTDITIQETYSSDSEENTFSISWENKNTDIDLENLLLNGLIKVTASNDVTTYEYDSINELLNDSYTVIPNINNDNDTETIITFGNTVDDISSGYLPSQIKVGTDESATIYNLSYSFNDLYELEGYYLDLNHNEDGTLNDRSITFTKEQEPSNYEPMPANTDVVIDSYHSLNDITYTLVWNDNNDENEARTLEKEKITEAFKNALKITAGSNTYTYSDEVGKALLANVVVNQNETAGENNTRVTINFGTNDSTNTTGLPKKATIDGTEYELSYSLQDYTPTDSSDYIYQVNDNELFATKTLNFSSKVVWYDGKDLNETRPEVSDYKLGLELYRFAETDGRGKATVLYSGSGNTDKFTVLGSDGAEIDDTRNSNHERVCNDWEINVYNLPQYDLEGGVYCYYIKQNTSITKDNTTTNFSKKPITGVNTSDDQYLTQYRDNLSKGDYSATYNNTESLGNYKNVEDELENGGTVTNTIQNNIWIDLGKQWIDQGTTEGRGGTFYLYRISESSFMQKGFDQDGSPVTGYDNTVVQTTDKDGNAIPCGTEGEESNVQWKHIGVLNADGSAQAGSDGTLLAFESGTNYTGALPLYSSEGNRYIYYAIESVPSGYEATVHNDYYSTNDVVKYNNQSVKEAANSKGYVVLGNYITNKKTGTTTVSAIKEFSNLAIQEIQGTTVTMALQSRVKTANNSNEWQWYTTTDTSSLKENLGDNWNTVNSSSPYALSVKDSSDNSYYVFATLSGFSADRLTIEQDATMSLYDSEFNELEYKWVEVSINFSGDHVISKKGYSQEETTATLPSDDLNGLLQAKVDGSEDTVQPILMPDQSNGQAAPGTTESKTTLLFKASYDEKTNITTNTITAPVNFKITKNVNMKDENGGADSSKDGAYKFTYTIYANGKPLTEDYAKYLGMTIPTDTENNLYKLINNNGVMQLEVTVSSGLGTNTISYDGLPRYDADGKEITYTAEEDTTKYSKDNDEITNDWPFQTTVVYTTNVVDGSLDGVLVNDADTVSNQSIKILEKTATFDNTIGPGSGLYIDARKEWLDDSMVDTRHPVNVALVKKDGDNYSIVQYATLREANGWYHRFTVSDDTNENKDKYFVVELDMNGTIDSSSYLADGVQVKYTSDALESDDNIGTVSDSNLKTIIDRVNSVISKVNTDVTETIKNEAKMKTIFRSNLNSPSDYLQYCVGTIKETSGNKIQQDYNVYIGREAGKTGAAYEYTIYNQRTATLNLHATKTWTDAAQFLDANFTIVRDEVKITANSNGTYKTDSTTTDFGTFSLTKNSTPYTQEEGTIVRSVKWTSSISESGDYGSDKAVQGGVKFVDTTDKTDYSNGDYPKYDAYGRAYNYGLKESSVGGSASNTTSVNVTYDKDTNFSGSYSGVASNVVDTDRKAQTYEVDVTSTTTADDYAQSKNHYYGGVYSWAIDNTRSESINLTVNKVWRDNGTKDRLLKVNNTDETLSKIEIARASITVSLYRISTKDYESFVKKQKDITSLNSSNGIVSDFSTISESTDEDTQINFRDSLIAASQEVSGNKTWTTTDSDWWWHADLGSQKRYDSNGYPYIYYVVENIVDDAAGYVATYFNGTNETYSTDYRPTKVEENDYSSSKDVFNPEDTTDSSTTYNATDYNYMATILVDGEEHSNYSYNEYYSSTIVNTPKKGVNVSGKKLWKLQDGTVLPADALPEVDLYIYRSVVSSYEKSDFIDSNKPLEKDDSDKYIEFIGHKQVGPKENYQYSFTNDEDPNGYYEYYNEYGQKYNYYVIEGDVDGYELVATAGNFTVNNIYNPKENHKFVKITVEKFWDANNAPQDITATFKLYGYATDKDGNVIKSMKYLLATKEITSADQTNGNELVFETLDSTNTLGYSVGEDGSYAKIPYISPSTYPFAYEVVEQINGYTATFSDFQTTKPTSDSLTTDTTTTTLSSGAKTLVVEGSNQTATHNEQTSTYETYMGIKNAYDPTDTNHGKINIIKSWKKDEHYKNLRTTVNVTLSRSYAHSEETTTEYAKTIADNKVTEWSTTESDATTIELTSDNNWKKTFEALQIYASNGTKYSYVVKEKEDTSNAEEEYEYTYTVSPLDGVTVKPTKNGVNATITNTLTTTSVKGNKVWNIKDSGNNNTETKLSSLSDDQLLLLYRSGAIPGYFRFYLVDDSGKFYTKDSNSNYSLDRTVATNNTIPTNAIYHQVTIANTSNPTVSQIKSYLSSLETGYTFTDLISYTYTSEGNEVSGSYDIVEAYSYDGENWTWQYKGDSDTGKLSNKTEGSGVETAYAKNNTTTTYTNDVAVSSVVVKKIWSDDYNSQNTRPDTLNITVETSTTATLSLRLTKSNVNGTKGNEYISEVLYLANSVLDNANTVAIESASDTDHNWSNYTTPTDNKVTLHKTSDTKDTITVGSENCYYFELTNSLTPSTKKLNISATKKWSNFVPYESGSEVGLNETIYLTLEYSTDQTNWSKATANDCGLNSDNDATKSITASEYIKDNSMVDVTKTWTVNQYAKKSDETAENNTASPKEIYYRVVETKEDGTHYTDADSKAWSITYGNNQSSEPIVLKGSDGDQSTVVNNLLEHTILTVNKNWYYSDSNDALSSESVSALRNDGTLPYSIIYAIYAETGNKTNKFTLVQTLESTDETYSVTFTGLAKSYGNKSDLAVNYYVIEAGARYGSSEATPVYNSVVYDGTTEKKSLSGIDTSKSTNGTVGEYDAWFATWKYDSSKETQSISATNTLAVGDLSASKTWSDENDRDKKRSDSVIVTLYRIPVTKSGDTYTAVSGSEWTSTNKAVTLSSTNNWTDTFSDLPVKVAGKANQYWAYALDESVTGYKTSYSISNNTALKIEGKDAVVLNASSTSQANTTNVSITNAHEVERFDLTANKNWDDSDALTNETRSDYIYLKLQYKSNDTDEWKTVPAKSNSPEIQEAYYTSITNENNKVEISTNTETGIVTVESKDGASVKWNGISKNYNGSIVQYRIVETDNTGNPVDVIDSYTVTNNNNAQTVIINNTLVKGSISIQKEWVDDNNRDGLEGDVVVQLYRDGKEYDSSKTMTTNDDGELVYTWNNLPVYKNGSTKHEDSDKSVYTIQEVSVNGVEEYEYESTLLNDKDEKVTYITLSKDSSNSYTLKNTHEVNTVVIEANKIWNDGKDSNGLRPETITLELQYLNSEGEWVVVPDEDDGKGKKPYMLPITVEDEDGNETEEKELAEVTIDSEDSYSWQVTGFADGKEVEYRVIEKDVEEGYKSDHTADSTDISVKYSEAEDGVINVDVTNTLLRQAVTLEKHANSENGTLLSNAEYILTRTVDEEVEYFTGYSDNSPVWSTSKEKAMKLVTDSNGTITVSALPIGQYSFIETKAPNGYEINEKPVVFEYTVENISTKQVLKQVDKKIPTVDTGDHDNVLTNAYMIMGSIIVLIGIVVLRKRELQ